MWLVRLLKHRRWLVWRPEWRLSVSPVTHKEAARSCWIRSLSRTLSFCLYALALTRAHTHTHSTRIHIKGRCMSAPQGGLCGLWCIACVNTFLRHRCWSMHPSPKPKRGKEAAWAQKKNRDSSVQISRQAQAGRALHRESLARSDQPNCNDERWMVRHRNGDQCYSWPN